MVGGVAVGTVCNLLIGPHGAILIGIVAGVVSVVGYRYLSVRIYDNSRKKYWKISGDLETTLVSCVIERCLKDV